MNKKAQERIVYTIYELIATILIIGVMMLTAAAYGKLEAQEKLFLAKDIAFNLDALHAIEGDYNFIYAPNNLNKYSYEIKKGLVTVTSLQERKWYSLIFSEPAGMQYYFIPNEQTNKIEVEFRNPAVLTFIKRGNKITIIDKSVQPNETESVCPETKNKDKNWRQNKAILIDPLADINPSFTLSIAELLKTRINPDKVQIISQETLSTQKIQFLQSKQDILLIIKASDENIPKITISYNNINENSILICLITKEFYRNPTTEFSETDQLLNQADNIAIKIEINPNLYKPDEIRNMIYNAIQNYYE